MSKTINPEHEAFIASFNRLSHEVHNTAVAKGWWEKPRNDAEMICLVHCELSEAVEGLRAGNPPDDKIPAFSAVEAELADSIVRIMDMSAERGWKVAEAIVAKMAMNKTREVRHGGKKF